jgi:DNA-binding transcriptional ArsR family regulator
VDTFAMSKTPPPSPYAAAIAHALSHPIRIEILTLLSKADLTVGEITGQLKRPQANISQHLAVLREVHLVEATREGMSVEYRLSAPAVRHLLDLLNQLAEHIPAEGFVPRGRGRRRGGGGGRGCGRHRQDPQNR